MSGLSGHGVSRDRDLTEGRSLIKCFLKKMPELFVFLKFDYDICDGNQFLICSNFLIMKTFNLTNRNCVHTHTHSSRQIHYSPINQPQRSFRPRFVNG